MKSVFQFFAGAVVGFLILWTINFIAPVETQHSYFKPQFTFTNGWQFKINRQVNSEAELYEGACNSRWFECYYIIKNELVDYPESDLALKEDGQ